MKRLLMLLAALSALVAALVEFCRWATGGWFNAATAPIVLLACALVVAIVITGIAQWRTRAHQPTGPPARFAFG